MRRFLALLVGGLGAGALWRRRRRRAASEPEPSPADELRAKLAETRAPEPEDEPAADDDVGNRRSEVHDRARRSLDELG